MPIRPHRAGARRVGGLLALTALVTGCSSALDSSPPTVEPARAAKSPPASTPPAGTVTSLPGSPRSALYDRATSALVVLTAAETAALTMLDASGGSRTVRLPGAATAIAGDDNGTLYACTRGGVFVVDLATATVRRREIAGESGTEFTAVARRADGRLVLGSADGAAYTLAPDLTVSRKTDAFARVDAIVAVGDTSVVLDRAQTSVTALDSGGVPQQALRAGLGATSIVADAAGRVLVTDTRGGQLLVFSVDPLIARQAYPVGGAPFGLAGSRTLAWVSLTEANTVVGYDLATGIPVEKVRYPTVQQPNWLVIDDSSATLYVVSGSGAGVQAIPGAGARR